LQKTSDKKDVRKELEEDVLKISGAHKFKTSGEGFVGFWFDGIEGEALALLLDMEGVPATTDSPCLKRHPETTGLTGEQLHGSLVIKWNDNYTEKDAKHIAKIVEKNVERLKKISPMWEGIK